MPTKQLAVTLENLAVMLLTRASGKDSRLDQVRDLIKAAQDVVEDKGGRIAALIYGPSMEQAKYLYRVDLPWARTYSRLAPYIPAGPIGQEVTKALLMSEALMAAARATMAAYMEVLVESVEAPCQAEPEVLPG